MASLLELAVGNPLPLAQLAAAVLLALLATFVLVANPRRPSNVAFSAFLTLVAANYALVYLANLAAADGPLTLGTQWPHTTMGLRWASLATAFNLFDPLALLFFVALYPERGRLARPAVLGGALAVTTVFAVANFLDPISLFNGSPWHLAFVAWYSIVYATCLVSLLGRVAHGGATLRGKELRLVASGCAVAVITRLALIPVETNVVPWDAAPSRDVVTALLQVAIAGLLWAGFRAFDRSRSPPATWASGERAWNLTAACLGGIALLWFVKPILWLPYGTGHPPIGSIAFAVGEAAWLSSYAVRWVVFAAIVSYALLRYQVFDLDLRLKRAFFFATAGVLGLTAFLTAFFILEAALGMTISATISLAELASLVLAVALLAPLARVARRFTERVFPGVAGENAAYVRARKLEVYRAALEPLAESTSVDAARDEALEGLRRRLGVTMAEHDAMLAALRAAGSSRRAPGLSRPGDVVLARYRLGALLGQGSSGRAFLATDLLEARQTVVKEIISDSRDGERAGLLALREARSVAEIVHPCVLRVERAEREGEAFFVVMEYAPGGSLKERLASSGALGPVSAVRVARDVLDGLAAVHARGVVHRDVKPANVLFGADGRAKIADFGVAHVPDLGETLTSLSDRFQPGTPYYMAPEQIEGRDIGASADSYAVAAILYESISGRRYLDFRGLDLHAVREHIAAAAPQLPLKGVSAELNEALARGLAKEPEARFGNAAAFSRALAETPEGRAGGVLAERGEPRASDAAPPGLPGMRERDA